jgi:hypothetical protein
LVVVVVGNAVEMGVISDVDMEGIVGERMDDDWMDDDGSTGVAFNAARIAGSRSACKVVGCNSAARPSGSSEFHREDKPSGMSTALLGSREIALLLAMVDAGRLSAWLLSVWTEPKSSRRKTKFEEES